MTAAETADTSSHANGHDTSTNSNHDDTADQPATIGVILPPPEIRAIIDKTANFVATRGGMDLEDKLREKERSNAKFSFLSGGDPYYGYYQIKLVEARSGKVLLQEAAKPDKSAGEAEADAAAVKAAREPPPTFEFCADSIPVAAQDLDIIKLTAQFVARNGRQFMAQLQQKEARNFQFDFLRHGHSMFNYFSKLVEQYTKILLPSTEMRERLELNVSDKYSVLSRCVERTEWERHEEETRRAQAEEEEREKVAFQQIDWHDFVVMQAVEITADDERMELPPPLTVEAIQSMTLAQRKAMFDGVASQMHTTASYGAHQQQQQFHQQQQQQQQQQQPVGTTANGDGNNGGDDEEMDMGDD